MAWTPGRSKWGWQSRWPRFVLWLVACLLVVLPAAAEAPARVVLILSDAGPMHGAVAEAFTAALAGKFPVHRHVLEAGRDGELAAWAAERTLLVPIGVRALREVKSVQADGASTLALLVPRTAARTLGGGSRESAVYIDQPPERSLAFVKRLLPKARRVGVLVSDQSVGGLRALAAEVAKARMELEAETVSGPREMASALQRLLPVIDVLLLVPDSEVVNEQTVRHLLIASYRQRVPVVGFSRGLAHAGAVASLVTDPADIGRQGGFLARYWNPGTGRLPDDRYAEDFEMVFNQQVARSLEVDIPNGERELAVWRDALR